MTPSACGIATTTNTDSISITGGVGTTQTLVLDMSGGAFGPGATGESSGTSEIEIATSLGDATDAIVVKGTPGDDTIRIGQSGLNLNSDTDVDVTFAPLPALISVSGLGGANVLYAKGGSGTGSIFLGNVILTAGDDPGNVLDASAGATNQLVGGASNDVLNGQIGSDTISGGGGNDTIVGNDGSDEITGGPGLDSLTASGGNDTIHAWDDEADTLISGGSGTDTAEVDTGVDPATVGVETVIGDGAPPPPHLRHRLLRHPPPPPPPRLHHLRHHLLHLRHLHLGRATTTR